MQITPTASSPRPAQDFPPIPEVDAYRTPIFLNVIVEEVKLREIRPEFRAKWDIEATHDVNIKFRIIDGEFARRVIFGSARAEWFPTGNCRLRHWAQSIMGVDQFPADYIFDTDHLLNQQCRVTVQNYQKKDNSTGEKVRDVYPAVPTGAVIPPQGPAQVAPQQFAQATPQPQQPQVAQPAQQQFVQPQPQVAQPQPTPQVQQNWTNQPQAAPQAHAAANFPQAQPPIAEDDWEPF